MKLEEKLMKLRKDNAWSQEELADKLNVTRQTVSKWELGQSVPDTENLTKIASTFGISVNDLLDEGINPSNYNYKSSTHSGNRESLKILLLIIILIVVILGIGAIVLNKLSKKAKAESEVGKLVNKFPSLFEEGVDIWQDKANDIKENENEINEQINNATNKALERMEAISEENNKANPESFNRIFKTLYYGSTDGFFMKDFIDAVIKSNEENPDNLIVVEYKNTETNNATEIRALKENFKTGTNYEIIYEYDENGLINKAIIEE